MRWLLGLVAIFSAACGDNEGRWLESSRLVVNGYDESNEDCRTGLCGHDENTDLVNFGGHIYLVHRTAESQVLGPNSSLRISRSDDEGATWSVLAIIPAPSDRDLRDPHFYVDDDGNLNIKAITRLPHTSQRDSDVDSISVRTVSADQGLTWSNLSPIGPPTWSFWRIRGDAHGNLYSAAYEDGDKSVKLFSSVDGATWTPGAMIYDVAEDTPLETELIFDGDHLTALVRMDGLDNELLGSQGRLRTKVCTADYPFASFTCARELTGVRLDGPVAFAWEHRTFVVARKHFLEVENRKRTALYEIVGDGIVEHGELPSTGDTAYAGVASLEDSGRFLVSYYSSNLHQDGPWVRAMLGPTDIREATIDLRDLPVDPTPIN
ncbi:sialidase family protein [soil metagenome]